MAAKIFPAARERLIEIWSYTEEKWGEEQADTYVNGLVEAINLTAERRHRWRSVKDADLRGLYFFRYRHHYIFFRELSGGVLGVISILHENMDIPSRLREDNSRPEDG